MDDDLDDFIGLLPAQTEPVPQRCLETDDEAADFLPPLPPEPPTQTPGVAEMPQLLVRSLNQTPTCGWPYHPRSDRHSVIKCLGLLLDLLRLHPTLREALETGRWVWGINSKCQGKALDLVIGYPGPQPAPRRTLREVAHQAGAVVPTADLQAFGDIREGLTGEPVLVVEAKAVMTDHLGALPRLTDELEHFRHRFPEGTQRVALVLVNVADTFVSPGRNPDAEADSLITNSHRMPEDADRVYGMLRALRAGFDHVLTVSVRCPNDRTPIRPARTPDDLAYEIGLRAIRLPGSPPTPHQLTGGLSMTRRSTP